MKHCPTRLLNPNREKKATYVCRYSTPCSFQHIHRVEITMYLHFYSSLNYIKEQQERSKPMLGKKIIHGAC